MADKCPKRIYLQWDGVSTPTEDTTWCVDRIEDDDLEYVHVSQLAQAQKELAEAKAESKLAGESAYHSGFEDGWREALEDAAKVCDHAQLTTGPKALAAKIRRLAREGGKGEQE